MDATSKLLKQFALLFVIALVIAVPGQAASQLVANPTSIGLTSGGPFQTLQVTSSDSTAVNFTVQKGSGDTFYGVDMTSGTTPTNITVSLQNVSCALVTGTCSGTITLHPTSGGGTDVPVSVTFSTGGSGGSLNVSGNSFNLSTAVGGTITQNVTLSTTSTTAISYTIGSDASWLTVSPSSGTVSSANPVTLQISAGSSSLGNSTNVGHLTITGGGQNIGITVTLTVGTGGGSFSTDKTTLNLSAVQGNTAAGSFTISTTSGTAVGYSITPTVNWLTFSSTAGSVTSASPATITVTANSSGLTAGTTYTGTINVQQTSGGSQAIPITVNFTVNTSAGTGNFGATPTSFSFTAPQGGTAADQVLTITTPSSSSTYSLSLFNYSGVGNWLTVNSPSAGACQFSCALTGPQNLTLSVNTSGLSAGTSGTTYIYYISTSFGPTITVQLTITPSGTGSGQLTFTPSSLNFSAQVNGGAPASQSVSVGTPSSSTSYTVFTGPSWLTITPTGTLTGSQNLRFDVNPAGLSANTYSTSVAVTSGGNTQYIPVTLVVSTTGSGTSSVAAPTSLAFAYQVGTSNPLAQQILIAGNTGTFTAQSNVTWLFLSASSGTGPTAITASVNPSGLSASATPYQGTITITTSNGGSQSIGVSLLVSTTPVLFSNPSVVVYPDGASGSQIVPLTINASDLSAQTVSATSSATWVTLSAPSVSGSQTSYQVTMNPTGLCNGLNIANIVITGTLSNSPLNVPVVARITNASSSCGTGGTTVSVDKSSLTFTAQAGGSSPTAQTVSVTSNPTGVAFTITPSASWITASASNSQTTPSTLTVNVNPASLSANTYSGTITLAPTGGGTSAVISVNLTVTAASTVSATPTTLDFGTYRIGDTAPASKSISVTGGSGLTFTASASSTPAGWLTVTPASGATAATLTAGVNTASFTSAGTYTGTITVTGTGSATGTTTVQATINVTAPLPTMTKIGNAASFAVGAIAPGEVIYIEGTGLGPQTLVQASIDPATGKLATTIGGVSVMVGAFNAPMVYASNTKISAVVPYELKGFSTATIIVRYQGQSSNGITTGVTTTAPGIFTANSSGSGPGAILNPDLSYNTPLTPATKGSQVALFITGEGETNPNGVTGKITTPNPGSPILTAIPLLAVGVLVDNQPASIKYIGEVVGIVAGVLQINFEIPLTVRSGDVPISVNIGGNSTQTGVTLSVR